ncbi:hypothetical protein AB0L22_08885 [Micromonospora haikouensis]|uniref:hypothetical protein n=1 Tax=Micromonospora haikouensis TaxID=686309 RepID=UPI003419E294
MTDASPHPNPFAPLADAAEQVAATFTDAYRPALKQLAAETARLADEFRDTIGPLIADLAPGRSA